jgi:signal transduction histidine kinase
MPQPVNLLLKPCSRRPIEPSVDIRGLGAVSRRGIALAAAVLTLGLGTGAAASTTLTLAERDATSAALALRTASVRAALDTTFQRYADTMHDLVAFAASRPGPALDAALAGVVGDRLPGAHQVQVVAPDMSVRAARSVDGTTPAPVAVLSPAPELARAMGVARVSGRLVASPAHVLPTDADLPPAHRQRAFELAAPVHDTTFLGWVVVSVRAGDLLESTLRAAGVAGVTAQLTQTAPDGGTTEVARWSADGGAGHGAGDQLDVALAGHAWQILVRPTAAPVASAVGAVVLVAAALIGVLVAGVVLALDAARLRAARRARRAVAERTAQADRAQRAEQAMRERAAELTGFAAAAGENLHAPLHTIAGFTEVLLEDSAPQLDAASRGFLDRIGRSTQRMLGLVDELLAYTAAGDAALKPEPVDAERLALDVVAGRLDRLDGERPSIDVGELPLVTADAELLRQVLDQLVANAVRFVRHGTAARVTLGAREVGDGWWRIEVADRGIGVAEEHRERVFAPFHRTPSAEGFPGTGLGLAVARRIVALHGGAIGVDANPGGGSVFWFTGSATGVTVPDEFPELAAGLT